MKLIATKQPQLIAAQTGKYGIAAAKMLSFTILDETLAEARVGYYEMVEENPLVLNQPRYQLQPLNVTGSVVNQPNVKLIRLTAAQSQQIWQAIGGEITPGGNMLQELSNHLTTATLVTLVMDGNFVKIVNGEHAPLGMNDWQIIEQQELVTQELIDQRNAAQE